MLLRIFGFLRGKELNDTFVTSDVIMVSRKLKTSAGNL